MINIIHFSNWTFRPHGFSCHRQQYVLGTLTESFSKHCLAACPKYSCIWDQLCDKKIKFEKVRLLVAMAEAFLKWGAQKQ